MEEYDVHPDLKIEKKIDLTTDDWAFVIFIFQTVQSCVYARAPCICVA